MKNLQVMTDEELAVCYMEGDNRAFDLLLSRTQSQLFTYILFVVHDEETANDIFQESFVKAIIYLQRRKYSPKGKFAAWMVRIAHNVIMDSFRQKRMKGCVDLNDENNLSNLSSDDLMDESIETAFVNEQVLSDVKKLMEYLPAPQREVVFMRFYQNLSFKEIANITGVSINTSLGRMRYALMNMRKMAKESNVQLSLD